MTFSPIINLAIFQGENKVFSLPLNPRQDVTGWTVQWAARSQNVSFAFPPLTMLPIDLVDVWVPSASNAVVPGVMPALPVQGGTHLIKKNNLPPPGGGLDIQDVVNGIFGLTLTSTDTLTLVPDTFFWTLTRIDSGFNKILLSGTMNLLGQI